MAFVVAIRLLIYLGRSPCEPWLPCYFCAERPSVKNCPMHRHPQVPIKFELLTRRSGSQLEFTGHPLPETRLRHHCGSVEPQPALANVAVGLHGTRASSPRRSDYGWRIC